MQNMAHVWYLFEKLLGNIIGVFEGNLYTFKQLKIKSIKAGDGDVPP